MITLSHVSKVYSDVLAVNDVTFEVGRGLTALLGPNGAGKSTLLRMIAGMATPTSGVVLIDGVGPRTNLAAFTQIGLVPQNEKLPSRMTAQAFVRARGMLLGLNHADRAAAAWLNRVDLDPSDQRPLSAYSKGMRQRVKVAQALIADPAVLMLDEPLNGLDPGHRDDMIGIFRSLGSEGRCVLVSSHVLEEVQRMASDVVVIARGRIVAEGDFRQIRELLDDRPHRIRIDCDRPARLAATLFAQAPVSGIRSDSTGLVIETTDVRSFASTVMSSAARARVSITAIKPLDDDLESVFRYLVTS